MNKSQSIVAGVIAALHFVTHSHADTPPIVGAWQLGNGASNASEIIIFLKDGTYFYAGDTNEILYPAEFDGMERGTYTWNEANGSLDVTPIVDTSGTTGFSSGQNYFATIDSDVLSISDSEDEPEELNRVWSATDPIVGAWMEAGGQPDSYSALVFLSNGVYFWITDTDPADHPGELDGIERGTYSVDPVTGILYATPVVNTNGVASIASGISTVRIMGNLMTVEDSLEGAVTLNRIVYVQGATAISSTANQITIDFTGTLQTSTDLIFWKDVTPQPTSPWTFSPSHAKAFFTTRGK